MPSWRFEPCRDGRYFFMDVAKEGIALYEADDRQLHVPNARQCFIGLCIEHMEDGTDEQSMAGLFPVITLLEATFGIDQHVGNILDVAYLQDTAAHFEQRVVGSGLKIGGVEQQRPAET